MMDLTIDDDRTQNRADMFTQPLERGVFEKHASAIYYGMENRKARVRHGAARPSASMTLNLGDPSLPSRVRFVTGGGGLELVGRV